MGKPEAESGTNEVARSEKKWRVENIETDSKNESNVVAESKDEWITTTHGTSTGSSWN